MPDQNPTPSSGKPDGVGAARSWAYYDYNGAKYVTRLVDEAYQDIQNLLGLEVLNDAAVPTAAQEAAISIPLREAIAQGMLAPIKITYSIGTGRNAKRQQARVYCETSKIAVALKDLPTKKYWNEFNITEASLYYGG